MVVSLLMTEIQRRRTLTREKRPTDGRGSVQVARRNRELRGPITVLVADDHALVHRALSVVLRATESSDLKLLDEQAWTAQEAIVKAADLKPRVVVFDLLMPQGACSTFDAIRVISRKNAVLVYSALEDAQAAATAIRAGALGFLTKGGKGADLGLLRSRSSSGSRRSKIKGPWARARQMRASG
jgi:DNA-binding NarL/FixJ family response regulator